MAVKIKTGGKIAIGLILVAVIFAVKLFWWDNREKTFDAEDVIKVGVVTWPGYAAGQYMNGGFEVNTKGRMYQDYGLTVEFKILDDFLASRKAFENGEVDLLWCTVDAFSTEMGAKGTMLTYAPKILFQADWSRGGDAIVVRSGIETGLDMKGKTVAVAQGSPSHSFLIDFLKTNGLTTDDVKIQYVASAIDAANLFKQQAVDAAVVWSPDDADCINKVSGSKILASTKTATHIIADCFFAKDEYIKAHEKELQKFYEAWMVGAMEINTDKDGAKKKAAAIIAKQFQMTEADALISMNNVRYATHGDNMNFFGLGDSKSVTGDALYTKMAAIYVKLGMVENPVAWREASYSGIVSACTLTGPGHEPEKTYTFAPVTEADKTKKEFSTKKVTINFMTNSYTLTGDNKYVINKEFGDILKTYQSARIRIEGNTDNTGQYDANVTLSYNRAKSVKDYLVSEYKVDPNRIIVVGNGPKNAVAAGIKGPNELYRSTDFQLVE